MAAHNVPKLLVCAVLLFSVAYGRPFESRSNASPGPRKAGLSREDLSTAYDVLQKWYDKSTGLWIPSTGWWNSANCLTVVANMASINGLMSDSVASVFQTTFHRAPAYNAEVNTIGNAPASGFLDGYYDDEGWWALAWIAAYDVTHNADYLSEAETIFKDMYQSFGKTPCSKNSGGTGGIWWDKDHSYVNAIANELFLDVAAHLANRVPSKSSYYLDIAKKQWAWFKGSGMINGQNTINDGLDASSCKNNNGVVWSYNQGVILGGLKELSAATKDGSYVAEAKTIADASISKLSKNGILHEVCEPNCGQDASQFKGIFTRNLGILQRASPEKKYATFLQSNADDIWNRDRNSNNQLGLVWSGPFVGPANASTQSSAMDTLVAALSL